METIKNTQSGERLSFYKLFKEKNYSVLIPIIQRDYAQGRKNKKEVRETFLAALYQYLEENKPNRDLDFVYGSLSEVENQTDFIPLDGQQRLTTLFLLHWFLYQIQDDKNSQDCHDFKQALLKKNKSMFTYETRTSSSDYCNALMKNDIDFKNLLEADKDINGNSKENSLSKTIENSAWYFLSWQQDSTIQSMLIMLDAIHNKFAGKKEFFERLLNLENPIITFQFLNLNDFKLTDDLYIKMNSRGKPLTSFENFKAKFEQYLENLKLSTSRKFQLAFDDNVSLNKYFSYNIDTKWANLFWNYRELVGNSNIYDEELKNFIRIIFANQYATSVQIGKVGNTDKTDETFEFLLGTAPAKKRDDYTDDISFYKYHELNALSENGVLYLIDTFDNLVNGNDKLKTYLSADYKFYFDEEKVFENALKHSFANNQERIMFHAYIRFLIQNNGNTTGLEQWMRVIHNLAYNTIIDGAVEIARAIKSIEKMLPKSNDILNYIISNDIDGFASWQILEEKIKACLILKSTGNDWKTKIEETEKHSCFDGQIGFILEFAEIVAYYKTNNDCNWTTDKDYLDRIVNYSEKAVAAFENSYNNEFLWERAVLTKGDYLLNASSSRKNLLTTDKNTRDFSWKRLLRIAEDLKSKRQLVKQVFDDDLFDKNDLKKSLEKICENKTNTWRDYLITYPELIKYCGQGFIRFVNEQDIILLGSSQMNHYHAEMYTFYLWKEHFEEEAFQNLFSEKDYYWSKSCEELSCVFLRFCYNRINYEIDIYWNLEKAAYEIHFYKLKGNNKDESDYLLDMQDLLKTTLKFDWDTDKYVIFIKDSNNVKLKIDEICSTIK